eukprot:GHVU01088248.1.p1 GENE.GHVU01088248.1~~GHVU01088248.1.p1  ORF type:complete len:307 (+),score=55.43 GHVU01088248.1:1806-2726(+)
MIEVCLYPQVAEDNLDEALFSRSKAISDMLEATEEIDIETGESSPNEENAQLEENVKFYVSALLCRAKVHWDQGRYHEAAELLDHVPRICTDREPILLARTQLHFKLQRYDECIECFERLVAVHEDPTGFPGTRLLLFPPMSLANLCVAYVLTDRNEDGEKLIAALQREEATIRSLSPTTRVYHCCIINLVIGTLYCSKGQFEFGLKQVMKALEPLHENLGEETWHHAKRCLLHLADKAAKRCHRLRDEFLETIFLFLNAVKEAGLHVPACAGDEERQNITIATEAELLLRALAVIPRLSTPGLLP